jgi:DNA uptake protein ComE-like DNA-binding protein
MVLASIIALVLVIGYQLWQSTQPTYPLDLNSAPAKHLTQLQGIDEVTAQKIVANRPYNRKDELVRKQILNGSQYERIKEQIVARQK